MERFFCSARETLRPPGQTKARTREAAACLAGDRAVGLGRHRPPDLPWVLQRRAGGWPRGAGSWRAWSEDQSWEQAAWPPPGAGWFRAENPEGPATGKAPGAWPLPLSFQTAQCHPQTHGGPFGLAGTHAPPSHQQGPEAAFLGSITHGPLLRGQDSVLCHL